MKTKSIIKNMLFLPLVIIPLSLSSCSFFNELFNLTPNDNNNVGIKVKSENFKYISERTVSLKFWDPNINSEVYGTGWIFGRDTKDNNYYNSDYYFATNLHVASALNNRGKTVYEYDTTSNRYVQNYYPNYTKLSFGYVFSRDESGQYTFGSQYSNESISSTKYLTTLNIDTSVSIAYTSFNLFRQMQLKDKDNVYNNSVIENATSDIAILKINFSKVEENKQFQNIDPLGTLLDSYNKNPTKFGEYKTTSNITIAGFPFKEEGTNRGGKWTGVYHPSPVRVNNSIENQNISSGILFGNNSNWNKNISNSNMDYVKKNYVINGFIPFVTNEFASYYNVALQAVFQNVNLSGGSSGSLALDDNQNVVGIYWGGYSLSNGQEIGTIDLFINNNSYYDSNPMNRVEVIKPYSIINDFKSTVPNTNV